ncbi:MAG TPA: ABC transporter ATP-binding protein [Candidatus Dojkabacteria bacterium]|nr:ABC transporter ATP-binding protein [Candidatus Dojkabacteria bacterium]
MKKVISVKNLTKTFKVYKKDKGLLGSVKSLFNRKYTEVKAVDDISFDINKGEFVGFIGPNGAGKTTTLKCLTGLLYPTSGTVKVLGYTPWERQREYLKRVALVMGQKNQLWWDLPAQDSFELNKAIYEIPDDEYKKKYNELSELLEIKDILDIQVRKLSLGQRMRCELMSAFLHSPEVIFLDEPTIGLDVVMQKKLRSFFKEYNSRYDTTVILTSHYMDDVKELCKRVIIIDEGTILYDGKLDSLVSKYVKYRHISFIPTQKILKSDLKKLGEVVKHTGDHVILSVLREDATNVSAKLLKSFEIEDLQIDEMSLEDVIRKVFTKSQPV